MPAYLVTGASRGLGYQWITHLAKVDSKNQVFALVRNAKGLKKRLANGGQYENITILQGDITDSAALKKASQDISNITNGSLDVLIHNAALVSDRTAYIGPVDDDVEALIKDTRDSFDANVFGTAYVLNAFLPLLKKGTVRKVLVVSTGMADLDLIRDFEIDIATPYAISKAAANILVTKYHAQIGKKENILFFSVSPGFVNTNESGKAPTEEEMAGLAAMGAKFANYAPHFTGPLTPQQSIDYQYELLQRATVEEFGGSFVSHFGTKQWL